MAAATALESSQVRYGEYCFTGGAMVTYKTPRPMMQIRDALVRTLICTFQSIGAGSTAKNMSVRILVTGEWGCQ